jgi:tRNA-2-methylthio-N6-dimethylallyladenosine synthase
MNDLEKVIDGIDLGLPAPLEEPERQYYFIKKGREYVTARNWDVTSPAPYRHLAVR